MSTLPILVADFKAVRYLCPLYPEKTTYTISEDFLSDIYIPNIYVADQNNPFVLGLYAFKAEFTKWGSLCQLTALIGLDERVMDIEERSTTLIQEITFHVEYLEDAHTQIYLETETTIRVGRHMDNQIILPNCVDHFTFMLVKNAEGTWFLHTYGPSITAIYINGIICTEDRQLLAIGDFIHFNGYIIEMKGPYCSLYHQNACQGLSQLTLYESPAVPENRYPDFRRPPRQLYVVPTDKVAIPAPPSPPAKDRFGLLITLAPMLAMALMMALLSLVWRSGFFILLSVGMMLVMAVVTVVRYVSDKKEKKTEEAERVTFYENLLNSKRKQIRDLTEKQRQALENNYPNPHKCLGFAKDFSPRLWERARDHTDFFHLRIGVGEQPPSFPVEYSRQETKDAAKDPLVKDAEELAAQHTHIINLPVSISLLDAYIGIIGKKELTVPHALAMLTHLTILHSYLDLSLILIYTEAQEEHLSPFRWAPHTWLGDKQFKGLVRDPTTRDNVLASLHQVIKQRKNEYDQDNNKEGHYLPLVFVIAELDLVYNHVIMEYLNKDHRHLGVFAIFLSESEYALPEATKTLIRMASPTEATLYQEKDPVLRPYRSESLTGTQIDLGLRALAPIQHLMTSSDETMPKSVTLFELLRVNTPEELDIKGKWRNHKPYKTLAVPIGLRSANSIIELNLHEQAHGPHGLLAGTTGSGKSETLQTYIVSLAMHFHPHDLAFLLIDYKGGGMAKQFEKLPHLLGTITNLDAAQTMRALIAIDSELLRRQAIFDKHDINHVDTYQKLREEQPGLEPMPHLFIISDEFAELKSQFPDFVSKLVSVSRVGRSLGIHLLLATQKPSGVVDDQIWSNSSFRICLKVQNAADSNEMLKTPDAADIKLPGRGYLQVGNNEIYELFQSAYAGVPYNPAKFKTKKKPNDKIYQWTELGQFRLLTHDFSAFRAPREAAKPTTELDVTIEAIQQAFAATGLAPVPNTWLPPLEETLFLAQLVTEGGGAQDVLTPVWVNTPEEQNAPKGDVEILVGMMDEIEHQRQTPLAINFTKSGHVGIWGSAATGKSTFLHTIALSLALRYTPSQVNFLLFDFGNKSLQPLELLPHTADILTPEDTEKLAKLQRLLKTEMQYRKGLLGLSRVPTITMHNQISGDRDGTPIPALFLFIDNYDPIYDGDNLALNSHLENLLKDIARDGQALSMYLIFTASRSAVVRSAIMGTIQNKFMFHMIDESEIYTLLGRTELKSAPIPGRGLTQANTICTFQAALPAYGATVTERITRFQALMGSVGDTWKGPLPGSIPMMPDVLPLQDFYTVPSVITALNASDKQLPLSLDNETLQAVCVDFAKISHINITGTHNIGKTNIIRVILESLLRKERDFNVYMIDDKMLKLYDYQERFSPDCYLTAQPEISALLEKLIEEVRRRKDMFSENQKTKGNRLTPAAFYAALTPYLVIVNNVASFISLLSMTEQESLSQLLEESKLTGVHFCFVSNMQDFPQMFNSLSGAIKNINSGFTFLSLDQPQFLPLSLRAAQYMSLRPGESFYVNATIPTLVKIPFVTI